MLPAVTSRTRTFIRAGLFMSRPVPPPEIRAGYYAPYSQAGRRDAIEDFVADIPLDPDDVSAAPLDAIADGLGALADIPVLLLWGPRDPVFSDLYLRDLIGRLPHADVHRYEGSSHFVPEDAPTFAADVATWVGHRSLLADLRAGDGAGPDAPPVPDTGRPLWAGISERAADPTTSGTPAVTELGPAGVTDSAELRRAGRPGHARGRGARGDRRRARGADRPAGPSRHRPDRRPLRDLARRGRRRGRGRRARDPGHAGRPAQRGPGLRDRHRQGPGRRSAHGHRARS